MSRRRIAASVLLSGLTASLLMPMSTAGAAGAPSTAGVTSSSSASAPLTECREFDGQRYCLGVGFTRQTEQQVQARLAVAARTAARRTGAESTGDLDALALARRQRTMSPAAREREFAMAARSVGKVLTLRAPKKTADQYRQRKTIMKGKRTKEQNRSYWCGPAATQSIVWGWRKRRQDQRLWARRLGTTTAGSAITDLVRVVNNNTGYDKPHRAGTYITLDIGDYSFDDWYLLMMRHIEDYRAPVILHPVLLKRFYPYLDDDASGHFQVGRGFDKNPGGEPLLGYFEPWNQQRFDPSEPFIKRVQWQPAYPQYRANQAHFQHNVGV